MSDYRTWVLRVPFSPLVFRLNVMVIALAFMFSVILAHHELIWLFGWLFFPSYALAYHSVKQVKLKAVDGLKLLAFALIAALPYCVDNPQLAAIYLLFLVAVLALVVVYDRV